MEFSEAIQLNRRKESVAARLQSMQVEDDTMDVRVPLFQKSYPFAVVLRLRVLQIVCGISSMVMGMVAFIEEREEFSLALGIPAGAVTVLAAAVSIHTTRGFDGYRASTCPPGSRLRFLGPNIRVAVPLCVVWGCACVLQVALLTQASRSIAPEPPTPSPGPDDWGSLPDHRDLVVLAGIQIFLTTTTLIVVVVLVRIDCKYDPD